MSEEITGFVGLGAMGGPMCGNIAESGRAMSVYDAAGTQARAPRGAHAAGSVAGVCAKAQVVVLSLPDGSVVDKVTDEIIAASPRVTSRVVDTSTIGIPWARRLHAKLAEAGIEYLDAPVSGGRSGAIAGTVAIMYAGSAETFAALKPLFATFTGNAFHVGLEAGQGQAMKLLNNFLSATAMAATSEAIAFGETQGLDLATMLNVVNVSSGRNTATADKFVNRVLTGTYDAGFTSWQMNKDLSLYREGVETAGSADPVSGAVAEIWQAFLERGPGSDITEIYPFIKGDASR
ncbi:MAG: NAD(P)-dependent oxidoreductase [Gammaproteobacteria bacterium]|nr:NAD(P)-dependent oxidoreductase [Gammaproteobacteria bacterium]